MATAKFFICNVFVFRPSSLQVEVPDVEGEDGSVLSPLSVTLLEDGGN